MPKDSDKESTIEISEPTLRFALAKHVAELRCRFDVDNFADTINGLSDKDFMNLLEYEGDTIISSYVSKEYMLSLKKQKRTRRYD